MALEPGFEIRQINLWQMVWPGGSRHFFLTGLANTAMFACRATEKETMPMSMKTSLAGLVAGVFMMSAPMTSHAQQVDRGFVFSEALQTSIDAFRASQEDFRSAIHSAVEGLSRSDRQDVLASHAAEAEARHEAARSLHAQAAAEMTAAGFEPPEGREPGPNGGHEAGHGGPGGTDGPDGPGGPDGNGAGGPDGDGPGGDGPGGPGGDGPGGPGGDGPGGPGGRS